MGDVHHIFPKQYLRKSGYNDKRQYNQIANFTYLDTQVNIAISNDAPCVYFKNAVDACRTGVSLYGNITDVDILYKNMEDNCIPAEIVSMDYTNYDNFLISRRRMMARKIRLYYEHL